jgi:hypothetical protein
MEPHGSTHPRPEAARNDEIDRAELKRVDGVFVRQHRLRLEETRARLTPTRRDILDALPCLLHFNHPLLPGFSGYGTPVGIDQYVPSRRGLKVLEQFTHLRQDHVKRQPTQIRSLFLMGSSGSVAQTQLSDLDVWVVAAAELHAALTPKLEKIAQWAASMGVELQCFAVASDQFERPTGASGSPLLLDEFYRSATYVAGRHPLWWLIPDEVDDGYDSMARRLLQQRFVHPHRYVDFGPVGAFAHDEILFAAVRELERSLKTPHKSLLKLALLESYWHGAKPLSSEYKRRTLRHGTDAMTLDDTDSYVLLGDHLSDEFAGQRQGLLRRAWLLKTARSNAHLNRTPAWSQRALDWQFDAAAVEHLRDPSSWSLTDLFAEQTRVISMYGYAIDFITQLAGNQQTSDQFHHTLAKVRAIVAELRPYFLDSPKTLLPALVPRHYRGSAWVKRSGTTSWAIEDSGTTVHRDTHLVGALHWLERNGFAINALHYSLRAEPRLRQIFAAFRRDAPVALVNAEASALMPMEAHGDTLVTPRDDPLCYGERENVLVSHLDITTPSSTQVSHFEDVGQGICALLSLSLNGSHPKVSAVGDVRRHRIQRRLEGLIRRARDVLASDKAFAFSLGRSLAVLHYDTDHAYPRLHAYTGCIDCFRYLPLCIEVVADANVSPRYRALLNSSALARPTLIASRGYADIELHYRATSDRRDITTSRDDFDQVIADIHRFNRRAQDAGHDVPQILVHDARNDHVGYAAVPADSLLRGGDSVIDESSYMQSLATFINREHR